MMHFSNVYVHIYIRICVYVGPLFCDVDSVNASGVPYVLRTPSIPDQSLSASHLCHHFRSHHGIVVLWMVRHAFLYVHT